jgi:hypothetical protein
MSMADTPYRSLDQLRGELNVVADAYRPPRLPASHSMSSVF